MHELLAEYRERMGWNDQSVIMILCDYIDHINPPNTGLSFEGYLETRAREEESWCPSPEEEGEDD
jgi:hypothetical protein